MPELPEVEIARRQIVSWTRGDRVTRVVVAEPSTIRTHLSTKPADALPDGERRISEALTGATSLGALRVGKRLAWRFSSGDWLVHLGMSGKWVQRPHAPRHGRLGLVFDDAPPLWFVDPRRFGCLAPSVDAELDLRAGLGPDALLDLPDADTLRTALAGRIPVKNALMDQARLAGLGNIQAVESLWRAGIAPQRRADTLSPDEAERLVDAIRTQLAYTLDAEGSGEITYLSEIPRSEWGTRSPFAVYGRAGEPCVQCGDPVRQDVLSGRATAWCATCQG